MAAKKTTKIDSVSEMSYEELEKRASEILEELRKEPPLDKARSLYQEGLRVHLEMEERLSKYMKEVEEADKEE